jgi:hypothetical protein
LLKKCRDWRHIAKRVLIDDMLLERYSRQSRCNGPGMLAITFQRLSAVIEQRLGETYSP